jgi:hypothetical protein
MGGFKLCARIWITSHVRGEMTTPVLKLTTRVIKPTAFCSWVDPSPTPRTGDYGTPTAIAPQKIWTSAWLAAGSWGRAVRLGQGTGRRTSHPAQSCRTGPPGPSRHSPSSPSVADMLILAIFSQALSVVRRCQAVAV